MTNVVNQKSQKFDKEELTELFSDFELAFNPSLREDTQLLIDQYENEKRSKNKHSIKLNYTCGTYVSRVKENDNKTFYPKHFKKDKWEKGVGDAIWTPYRFADLQYCEGSFALMHEGEKATDYARYHGLISFSILGAKSRDEEFIEENLTFIQGFGLLGLIYIADHDDAGIKKANLVQSVGKKIDFPVLILPIKLLYPDAKQGDDIVEYLKANSKEAIGLNTQEYQKLIKANITLNINDNLNLLIGDYFIDKKESEPRKTTILTTTEAVNEARTLLQNIQDEIELNIALEELRARTKISSYTWKNDFIKPLKKEIKQERLVLEIQAFLQEPDPINRIYLKQSICGNYSINSKDFEFATNYVEQKNQTPEQIVFDGDEFFDLPDEEEEWLIPSLLPKGEMMLLTALPKVGKSLLASDIVYAVLTGEKVLGEEAVKSKVLYVGSDESRSSLKRRMRARGIDLIPNKKEKLKIVTYLDLTDTARLEKELEDFRPDLVIIDSLTSTTLNLGVSEKDAEFAKPIYRLKDLLKKYNCASVLIHHENKNKEAKGICKVSGSARITAAVWGIAQMTGSDGQLISENQEGVKNANHRILSLSPREGEKVTFNLNINPKDLWGEQGIFEFLGEADDPNGTKLSNRAIARKCCVDEKTVRNLRKSLSAENPQLEKSDNNLSAENPQLEKSDNNLSAENPQLEKSEERINDGGFVPSNKYPEDNRYYPEDVIKDLWDDEDENVSEDSVSEDSVSYNEDNLELKDNESDNGDKPKNPYGFSSAKPLPTPTKRTKKKSRLINPLSVGDRVKVKDNHYFGGKEGEITQISSPNSVIVAFEDNQRQLLYLKDLDLPESLQKPLLEKPSRPQKKEIVIKEGLNYFAGSLGSNCKWYLEVQKHIYEGLKIYQSQINAIDIERILSDFLIEKGILKPHPDDSTRFLEYDEKPSPINSLNSETRNKLENIVEKHGVDAIFNKFED